MFVELLEDSEKQALMSLLVNIAKADGNIDKSEIDFLSKYADDYNLTLDLEKEISISDACSRINSQKAKIVTIQEIVKLAIVDGNYDDAERKGVMVISEMLNIVVSKFEEIEKWVLDGQKWVAQGVQMLDDV